MDTSTTDPLAQWRHDLRDAISGVMLSATAVRAALEKGHPDLAKQALARIESSCARCVEVIDRVGR